VRLKLLTLTLPSEALKMNFKVTDFLFKTWKVGSEKCNERNKEISSQQHSEANNGFLSRLIIVIY
jgi:hypothetical protein